MPVSPAHREFFDKHQVAELMDGLISQVLRDRPAQPRDYLAQLLASQLKGQPPPGPLSPAAPSGASSAGNPWPYHMSHCSWPRGRRAARPLLRYRRQGERWPYTLSEKLFPRGGPGQKGSCGGSSCGGCQKTGCPKRQQLTVDPTAPQSWGGGCAPAWLFQHVAQLAGQMMRRGHSSGGMTSPPAQKPSTRRLVLVDVNNSSGAQAAALKRAIPLAAVICVVPPEDLESARLCAERWGVKGVEFRAFSPGSALPLADDEADLVSCTLGLELLPASAVREMRRVLRPDGKAVFTAHDALEQVDLLRLFHAIQVKARGPGRPSPDPCCYSSSSDMRRLLREQLALPTIHVDAACYSIDSPSVECTEQALRLPFRKYCSMQGLADSDGLLRAHLPAALRDMGSMSGTPRSSNRVCIKNNNCTIYCATAASASVQPP
eukprot:TRINITY_DN12465_c0_g3_i1.p1 TRINITY_DN12465_c0_g3~~TRINITY_DN12465_c0_g3_i1.p1  ORF type:complete len:463 (+),score=148.81 TRINITY_DN12465_c0_g3_i1:93-1391(+)